MIDEQRPGRSAGALAGLLTLALLIAGCGASSLSPSLTAEPSPTPSPTPTIEPTPTPIPLDQAMLGQRLTVLVAGADTSLSRRAAGVKDWNTDALIVVSISADKSRIDIMSLPRDTVDVPMPDGSLYRGKINSIAQKFGMETLRGAMARLLGVPIDRYVRVDMDDFGWMVDVVGGIDVDLKTRISDSHLKLYLQPGPIHLDGALALGYTRSRADSDYGRAARQQQVIVALVQKWLNPDLGSLITSAGKLKSLQTDIGLDELPTLLEIGRRAAPARVTAVVLDPPRFSLFVGFEPNSNRGWVMIPDLAAMRAYARSQLSD